MNTQIEFRPCESSRRRLDPLCSRPIPSIIVLVGLGSHYEFPESDRNPLNVFHRCGLVEAAQCRGRGDEPLVGIILLQRSRSDTDDQMSWIDAVDTH